MECKKFPQEEMTDSDNSDDEYPPCAQSQSYSSPLSSSRNLVNTTLSEQPNVRKRSVPNWGLLSDKDWFLMRLKQEWTKSGKLYLCVQEVSELIANLFNNVGGEIGHTIGHTNKHARKILE